MAGRRADIAPQPAAGLLTRFKVDEGPCHGNDRETQNPPRRITADECLCDHCPAKCCHYLASPIDTPETQQDFDYIRWYLLHNNATVFVESGRLEPAVYSTCRFLRPTTAAESTRPGRRFAATIRPTIANTQDDWVYEKYFETPEQVKEYMEVVLPRGGP